jgi:polygalacturonase
LFDIIFISSRQIVIELLHNDIYETKEYDIYINDNFFMKSNKMVQSIYGLTPDTTYTIEVRQKDERIHGITFTTKEETVSLNVRDFGATGDGVHDDTAFIQAAISSCPPKGRVFFPKGTYLVTTLFLKNDINIEIDKNAVLSGITDRKVIPLLPGMTESYDEKSEYNLGTWEGNPLTSFASMLTGIHVSGVTICGQGTIDGNASFDNWWFNTKVKNIAYRPRLIFLNGCSDITIQGITVTNSPSWNIHPYFSNNIKLLDLNVINPKYSPNTDGINPESCKNVDIIGTYFSVGDDCIALKSGKIFMGSKYKQPSENINIRQCYMKDGHGSVTIGSEIAGGVKNIYVTKCKFYNTDRGLRIKTRRGRGKDSIVDNIVFEEIEMDMVLTPFVINTFYFCDPDGHSDYVRTKKSLPIDHRTPGINSIKFENINCTNCHYAGAYFYGLPENKIKSIAMKNISISFAKDAEKGIPAMMDDVVEMSKKGIYANNIKHLEIRNLTMIGNEGKMIEYDNVDNLVINNDQDKSLI